MKLFGYKKTGRGKVIRTIGLVIVIVMALGAGAWAALNIWLTPPEVNSIDAVASPKDIIAPSPTATELSNDEVLVDENGRLTGMYTFLIAGEDDEAGGTDVIMVGRLDTVNGELNIISIPRDTMVNVPWEVKKANSYKNMYKYLKADYDEYIDAMIDGVKNLIGFEVDSYVTVDLKGFVELVDAIDGVEFDVPQNMKYSDPAQNLYIDLKTGVQTLDGDKAMQLVRFRRYTDGDMQRMEVQHEFLSALANKLISANTLTKIDQLVTIFEENVDTDMSYSNLLWYAKEFLGLDSDSIHFYTADTSEYVAQTAEYFVGASYRTLNVDAWIDQVNEYINPYYEDITAEQLDILTQNASGKIVKAEGTLETDTISSVG